MNSAEYYLLDTTMNFYYNLNMSILYFMFFFYFWGTYVNYPENFEMSDLPPSPKDFQNLAFYRNLNIRSSQAVAEHYFGWFKTAPKWLLFLNNYPIKIFWMFYIYYTDILNVLTAMVTFLTNIFNEVLFLVVYGTLWAIKSQNDEILPWG